MSTFEHVLTYRTCAYIGLPQKHTHTNLLRQPPLCFDVSVAGVRLALFILLSIELFLLRPLSIIALAIESEVELFLVNVLCADCGLVRFRCHTSMLATH